MLYTRRSLPLSAGYSIQEAPQPTEAWVAGYEHQLFKVGFEHAGHCKKDSRAELWFYVHFANMDTAQLAKIRTRLGPKYICVFETRFQDGFILECSNASSLEMFAPDSTHRVFRFPQLRFPLDLYRIHQRLRERFSVDRRAILGSTTEELEHYLARAETIHQRIAATDYKLDKDCDRYVYTIRGAIRHAWLLTWPVKDIRRLRVEARAMKTADDLGLPIHPKFGRLRESVRSEIELLRG